MLPMMMTCTRHCKQERSKSRGAGRVRTTTNGPEVTTNSQGSTLLPGDLGRYRSCSNSLWIVRDAQPELSGGEKRRARWPKWLEREFTDRNVRVSNPTSASRLPLSRLGQQGSIPAFMLPSGDMAVRHRKGGTAERKEKIREGGNGGVSSRLASLTRRKVGMQQGDVADETMRRPM
ncbi:hypothetical protein CSKR_102798 [Clonorchis sinensis]|uniref:Uncharacterized protein n=1 Tax=Clonorchis sinensis TaxID=79923 RepID=A0A3R7DJA7_CLOSI|nr:hypothetical protein CSKR_102798 [Clonorchis sinensis]